MRHKIHLSHERTENKKENNISLVFTGTPADPTADSSGNINIIAEAVRRGVKKFVLVTSIGTGDSRDAPPEKVYQVLEPVLVEKEKAEAYLKVLWRSCS